MNQSAGRTNPNDGSSARVRATWERIGESLFYVPSVFMAAAVFLAQFLVFIDGQLDSTGWPSILTSTVDSSRVLLSVIAGGTITAASVVFSLTLVAVQLASTQFSPRTLGTFLSDRVQQVIIGLVLGTFVYCMLVLRVIRAPAEEGGEPFIPGLSVIVAVLLGVTAMVAVIASINRTAQSLRVSSIARKIAKSTITAIHEEFGDPDTVSTQHAMQPVVHTSTQPGGGRANHVLSTRSGWVQDVDLEYMIAGVPEGAELTVFVAVGNYVLDGQRIATVRAQPEDIDSDRIRESILLGEHRSRQGDVAFGITQLVDIAVKALSPGVNDPNTAEEIVVRLGEILVEISVADLPKRSSIVDGRTITRTVEPTHDDYVEIAIEPIRRFARTDPRVLGVILRTLVTAKAVAKERSDAAVVSGLNTQIRLTLGVMDELSEPIDHALAMKTVKVLGLADEPD